MGQTYRDEHLLALGAVAATFGNIELAVFWALGAKAGLAPPKANIVFAGAPFHSMLWKLRALVAFDHGSTPAAGRFNRWADEMSRAAKSRNDALHSAWLDLVYVSPETLAESWPSNAPELLRLKAARTPYENAAVPGYPATISGLSSLAEQLGRLEEELDAMRNDGLFHNSSVTEPGV